MKLPAASCRECSNSKSGVFGVCDGDRSRGHSIECGFGIPKNYEGLTALMAERKPGVIHVVILPQTHASLAIQALEIGISSSRQQTGRDS